MVVISEEMTNIMGRTDRFYILKQSKLTFKASAPTVHISDIAQGQRMKHATSDRDYLFIAEFSNKSWSWRKDRASESQ